MFVFCVSAAIVVVLLCCWMWCGGVYIGGARMREKEDVNGDWEVIGCNKFVKTGPRMHLDIISD